MKNIVDFDPGEVELPALLLVQRTETLSVELTRIGALSNATHVLSSPAVCQ